MALGARGTTNYAQPKGSNTSVRGNRLSAKATPARSQSASNVRAGSRVGSKPSSSSQVTLQTRQGKFKGSFKGGPNSKMTQFQAPNKMPARLNKTAAQAISTQRMRTAGVAAALLVPIPFGPAAGISTVAFSKSVNNYSTVRLKAAGYKVRGTGIGRQIKPASVRVQAKAQRKLAKKAGGRMTRSQAKTIARSTRSQSRGGVGGGGRRNVRTRRDARGRYAGSY